MSVWRTAAGTAATAAALLVLCSSASAQIYWANEGDTTISRASLAGTITDPSFVSGLSAPTGVAVNGTHIFWSDATAGGSIGRANVADGSSPTATLVATTGGIPQGVGLDSTRVYWTHVVSGAGQVGRATIGGFVLNQSFQPTANATPCGVTSDADDTYWANPGSPGSVGAAHGIDPPNQSLITDTDNPCGVALASGRVYWTNQGGASGSIGRANIGGGSPNGDYVDTGLASTPCGVAVDGNFIYWTDPASDNIGRVALDGTTGLDPAFMDLAGGTDPCGIAVSPTQQATPAARDFGPTTVGDQSAIESIGVANTASSILDVTGVSLIGANPGQFQITGDGCTPAMTSAGLSCIVNVLFSPTAEGPASATLRIAGNASNSPTDVTLTGTGTAPPTLPPPPGPEADTTPPDTTITSGPSAKTKSKSATFAFTGSDAREVASFECKLEDGAFESCASPKTYSGFRKGTYTFQVRAVDAAGNVDPTPASRSWTVKKKKKKKK